MAFTHTQKVDIGSLLRPGSGSGSDQKGVWSAAFALGVCIQNNLVGVPYLFTLEWRGGGAWVSNRHATHTYMPTQSSLTRFLSTY
jgi:hypothetical protein